jgi:hypothetical protein
VLWSSFGAFGAPALGKTINDAPKTVVLAAKEI